MWNLNSKGEKEFTRGNKEWDGVVKIAEDCPYFKIDDEDELVSDDPVSCYNCMYRRWSLESFTCMHK